MGASRQISPAEASQNVTVTVDAAWRAWFVADGDVFALPSLSYILSLHWTIVVVNTVVNPIMIMMNNHVGLNYCKPNDKHIINNHSIPKFTGHA